MTGGTSAWFDGPLGRALAGGPRGQIGGVNGVAETDEDDLLGQDVPAEKRQRLV